MNARSSGALEVRFDIFLKHVFSTPFRRNSTILYGLGLEGNSCTSYFQKL